MKYTEMEISYRVWSKLSAKRIYVTETQYTQIVNSGWLKENAIYIIVKEDKNSASKKS